MQTQTLFFVFWLGALGACACSTETPTSAVVDNDYPGVSDASRATEVTGYKVWGGETLFRDAVAPGGQGVTQRTVFGRSMAYAVLAVGWDPSSRTAPTSFVAI